VERGVAACDDGERKLIQNSFLFYDLNLLLFFLSPNPSPHAGRGNVVSDAGTGK
jgi:hypothetical protein